LLKYSDWFIYLVSDILGLFVASFAAGNPPPMMGIHPGSPGILGAYTFLHWPNPNLDRPLTLGA
jgi:hypothetical protein